MRGRDTNTHFGTLSAKTTRLFTGPAADRVVALYCGGGWSVAEIAAEYGCDRDAVEDCLHRRKVKMRKPGTAQFEAARIKLRNRLRVAAARAGVLA